MLFLIYFSSNPYFIWNFLSKERPFLDRIGSILFEKFLNKLKRILFFGPTHGHRPTMASFAANAPFSLPRTGSQDLPGHVARQPPPPPHPHPAGIGPLHHHPDPPPSIVVPSAWCTELGPHSLPLSFSASARSHQAHPTPFSCEPEALHPSSSPPGSNCMYPIDRAAVHSRDFIAMPPRPP
jgi:hypothetical protein